MCIARNGATPATHGKRGKADHKNCRLIVICNVSISTSREWTNPIKDGVLVPWKSLRLVLTLSRRMISSCVSGVDTNYIPRLSLAILAIDTHTSTDCSCDMDVELRDLNSASDCMALSVALQAARLTKLYRRITATCMRGTASEACWPCGYTPASQLDSACDGDD